MLSVPEACEKCGLYRFRRTDDSILIMTKRKLRKYFDYLPNGTFRRRICFNRWGGKGRYEIGQIVKGSKRTDNYLSVYLGKETILFHRAVYMWHFGKFHGEIDHINGNRIDNRIENLRLVGRSQNISNLTKPPKNKSGIKGIQFRRRLWEGQISWKYKKYSKSSKDKQKIILWLREMREKLHGEFARH